MFVRGGFTFCGIDIADLGLEYAPEGDDLYMFRPAATKVHEESYDGHHGGYYYGATVQPKEFTLRCFFEHRNMFRGLMSRVYEAFRRGRSGKLIFQDRPWMYYVATVSDDIRTPEMPNAMGGVIEISMKAYFPFARSEIMYCDRSNLWYDDIMLNSSVVTSEAMVPATELTNLSGSMTLAEPLLLNPGTEASPVTIDIAGDVGDGLTITNLTNGQRMTVVGLTQEITGENGFLRVNARSGQVSLHTFNGQTENIEPGYLYHKNGFIWLNPAMVARRNVYTVYEDSQEIALTYPMEQDYTGEYIYINGVWREIIEQPDPMKLKLKYRTGVTGSDNTVILPMNKINIYAESEATIAKLKFNYMPTYA